MMGAKSELQSYLTLTPSKTPKNSTILKGFYVFFLRISKSKIYTVSYNAARTNEAKFSIL